MNSKDCFVSPKQPGAQGRWVGLCYITRGRSERIRDPVPLSGAALIFEELLMGAGLWMKDDGEYLSP